VTVVAIVPAHDEAERIGLTVASALSAPEIDRVLVVDDGSTDETAARAAAAGADVLALPRNAGKGGALEAGVAEISGQADIVVFLDADLGETASQAAVLVRPVDADEADMTIAVLPRPAGSGGFGLVKGMARRGIRALCGFEATAPLSGQRAIRGSALTDLTPLEHGYGVEVGLTVRACRAGLRVLEVPTTMRHAATGRDLAGFAHRGRQFASVAVALARLALRR
jgi:hypothetical protein